MTDLYEKGTGLIFRNHKQAGLYRAVYLDSELVMGDLAGTAPVRAKTKVLGFDSRRPYLWVISRAVPSERGYLRLSRAPVPGRKLEPSPPSDASGN